MEDKLVVGRRDTGDGLKGMERFAGNESEVVFPEWKQKLFDRMKFECGRVAVDVVEGRVKAESVRVGEDIDTVTQLVNMLIAQNRTGIKFDTRWFQNVDERNVITQIGEMSMRARRFQAWREARTEKVLAVRPRSGGGHSRQRQREVAKEKESAADWHRH